MARQTGVRSRHKKRTVLLDYDCRYLGREMGIHVFLSTVDC